MTNELDLVIYRSLSDLNEAALRIGDLSEKLGQALDDEVAVWTNNNGWAGTAMHFSNDDGGTWLAPPEWLVAGKSDEVPLYFSLGHTAGSPEDEWNLVTMTGAGQQLYGLWLATDTVDKRAFNKAWKTYIARDAHLPLHGKDFFLPLTLDREALAGGSTADALAPVREALDRLPELASRLEVFRNDLVGNAGSTPPTLG